MTDDELKALCESNARSVQANSSAIADLGRGMVQFREAADAFTSELRSWVEIHNQISDDQGVDLVRMDTADRAHDAQITALREAANADRQAFINQMNADRERSDQHFETVRQDSDQRFNELKQDSDQRFSELKQDSDQRFSELKQDSDQRFAAQQEVLQRMLLEIRSTNGAVSGLSDRVENLEQAS